MNSARTQPATSVAKPAPTRVAILGGGISALTSAWHLTRTPELRERFDVTVYQMGWRLGGKLASGRDPERGMRNLEHGLHVWFGWYENAFGLFKSLMQEWHDRDLAPADCPIAKWQDAFDPCNYTPLGQTIRGDLSLWKFYWGGNRDEPGTGELPMDPKGVITGILGWLEALVLDMHDLPTAPPDDAFEKAVHHVLGDVRELLGDVLGAGSDLLRAKAAGATLAALKHSAEKLPLDHGQWTSFEVDKLRLSLTLAHRTLGPLLMLRTHEKEDVDAHLLRNAVNVGLAVVRGMLNPDYKLRENDFDLDLLDGMELREFLKDNGADAKVVDEWTCIKSLYDTMFEYPEGRWRGGNYAAGTAIRVAIRMLLTYKGAALYLLNTGMGDVVIAPLYEVLKARGVKFKFFHKVTHLELSADGASLERIDLDEQARLNTKEYQPLMPVRGLNCWPASPLWQQLEHGDTLKANHVEFESHWNAWPSVGQVSLQRGVDFDKVVLGMALGAYKQLNDFADPGVDLRKKVPQIRQMSEALPLIPSGGVQLWCDKTAEGMGFGPGRAAAVSWAWPMDVWADMTPTLQTEDWGLDGPASVHYWCGVIDTELHKQPPSNQAVPEEARALLLSQTEAQMQKNAGVLWPSAMTPKGFDWQLLHADPASEGPERLNEQWIRANVDPTECCVGSPAKTTQLRLRADRSGVENLVIVGECAYTGLNTTCVESVVMAGMQGARALTGEALTVVGETFLSRGWK
jgi:uncharacterized protein with NAD-binding domain and iron-sulfur cluster